MIVVSDKLQYLTLEQNLKFINILNLKEQGVIHSETFDLWFKVNILDYGYPCCQLPVPTQIHSVVLNW